MVAKGIIHDHSGKCGLRRRAGFEEGQAALSVALHGPTGVAVDTAGIVYFAEGSIGTGSGLATMATTAFGR